MKVIKKKIPVFFDLFYTDMYICMYSSKAIYIG